MRFEILTELHDINQFECTSHTINDYIQNYALKFQNKRLHTVHLVYDNNILIGFFALSVYYIKYRQKSDLSFHTIWGRYPPYTPCLFIEMIGVDQRYSSSYSHFGSKFIEKIIEIADIVSQQYTAIRLIFLEALPNSIGFYFKNGFSILYNKENLDQIQKLTREFGLNFEINKDSRQILTNVDILNILRDLEVGNKVRPIGMFLDLLLED